MNMINLQKKISVTKLCGKTTLKRVIDAGGVLACGRFIGSATGTKSGETDYGTYTALTGVFRGVNTESGETIESGVCFLPDVAMDMIVGQLNGGAMAVEFAFDLKAVTDDASPVGFAYRAVPLIEQEGGNPLDRIQSKLLSLVAPKEEKQEEKQEEKAAKKK